MPLTTSASVTLGTDYAIVLSATGAQLDIHGTILGRTVNRYEWAATTNQLAYANGDGLSYVGNCRVTLIYSAKGGKLGEVDMWAQTWGYTSPTDTVGGYDIWAGSTWAPANMVRGSADVVFQLALAAV